MIPVSKHIQAYPRRRSPLAKRFCGDTRGVTAVEFALISPVLMIMIMGTIELGMIIYVSSVMESASNITARLGKTGFSAEGISREQTLLNVLSDRASGLLDMDDVIITSLSYNGFDEVGQEEPFQDANGNGAFDGGETYDDINGNGQRDTDMGAAGHGDANDVVLYTVTYPWQINTPIIGDLMGLGNSYDITVRTVVKNEPYDVQ